MLVCGIDIGARSSEIVVLDGDAPDDFVYHIADTGHDPVGTGRRIFDAILAERGMRPDDVTYVVATGYGRSALPFATQSITEITCHARGVRHVVPDVRTIVDIGGQDSKVIVLGNDGSVVDFAMNDRCAAGTGRFLEMIARTLDLRVSELADVASQAMSPAEISSMCAVFGETEVVGLLAKGTPRADVVAGVHNSVASRVMALASRLTLAPPVAFTGGVAKNTAMAHALRTTLGLDLAIPPEPQITGALGAALLAAERAARPH